MPKIELIAGFKDPVRRPRYIIWTGVVVLMIVAVIIPAVGITSTYWFCANVCHKVQDDAISAFDRSAHSKISCVACHMPVNADPVTFLIHKVEAGVFGGIHTVTNNFENPLNPHNHTALVMPEGQCTQCHSKNRVITPSPGIIIDHEIHSENGVQCTLCHNRTAHDESGDWEPVTKHPQTGESPAKHADWMTMTACFRCHGLEEGAAAPGACAACHPSDFELKPGNHFEEGFYPRGHADMALEAAEVVEEAAAKAAEHGHGHEDEEGHEEEGHEEEGTEEEGHEEEGSEESTETSLLGIESAHASGGDLNPWAEKMPSVGEVNYCSTCHVIDKFCVDCHKIEMPHPEGFVEGHGDLGKSDPAVCANCHAKGEVVDAVSTEFCNNCHHSQGDPNQPWMPQHYVVVREEGAQGCFDCHDPTYCAACHVRGSTQ